MTIALLKNSDGYCFITLFQEMKKEKRIKCFMIMIGFSVSALPLNCDADALFKEVEKEKR